MFIQMAIHNAFVGFMKICRNSQVCYAVIEYPKSKLFGYSIAYTVSISNHNYS